MQFQGYKLVPKDGRCFDKTYKLNKTVQIEKGELILGKRGLHFCRRPESVFLFKTPCFDTNVYECAVEGTILFSDKTQVDNNACTKLTLVRLVSWDEYKLRCKERIEMMYRNPVDDIQRHQIFCALQFLFPSFHSPWKGIFFSPLKYSLSSLLTSTDHQKQQMVKHFSNFYHIEHRPLVLILQHSGYLTNSFREVSQLHRWKTDFLSWFCSDCQRKAILLNSLNNLDSTTGFITDLVSCRFEKIDVWLKEFPHLEKALIHRLLTCKTHVRDSLLIDFLNDRKGESKVAIRQFGVFVTGCIDVFQSSLQCWETESLSGCDVIDAIQHGHTQLAERVSWILLKKMPKSVVC